MDILQKVEKELDDINDNKQQIQITKNIMRACEKRIKCDELIKQTNRYKTHLKSFEEFTKNETLANLIKKLSVVNYSLEQIQIAPFEEIDINFGAFNMHMSDSDSRSDCFSEVTLWRTIIKKEAKFGSGIATIYKERFDIEHNNQSIESGIELFYKKHKIVNVSLELFKKFIETIRDTYRERLCEDYE